MSDMKRALILHGTDGSPQSNWFPWLKQKLEGEGYEVWAPELPDNHTPNRHTYNEYLFSSGWDFTNSIVVGHSSGAVAVLNLLMDDRCPHIRLGVMVGAWATNEGDMSDVQHQAYESAGLSKGQFKYTFPPEGFDFDLIRSKADRLAFLHGDDDPYCPLEQAQWLAKNLGADIKVIQHGGHLGTKFKELPEVWEIIEKAI